MFGRRIELFSLFGFKVRLDTSWFLIFVLVAWSLAAGLFPAAYPGRDTWVYWAMGIVGAVGLFVAVVLHEFAHSAVARRHGLPMEGITLFLFGGVAEMSDEPPDAATELKVALAGPAASIVIGVACFGIVAVGAARGWSDAVVGVVRYLAEINIVVAIFNMLPAFPLDGGRVLRSVLWKVKGDLRQATRIASRIGAGLGGALILLALVTALLGNLLGGVWLFLIGLFVRHAAHSSYRQLLLRRALEGEPVRRFMSEDPVVVPRSIPVRQLVDDYVYRTHHKLYPVVEGDRLVGCVTTRDIQRLPRSEWDSHSVSAVMSPCDDRTTIRSDADAMDALSRMRRGETTRLLVVEDGDRLAGILTMKDLLQFFSLKLELELDEPASSTGLRG
jgi:Zn-dependent protease/CBS domain-containing protein